MSHDDDHTTRIIMEIQQEKMRDDRLAELRDSDASLSLFLSAPPTSDDAPLRLIDLPPITFNPYPVLPICAVCNGASVADEDHPAYCPACRSTGRVEPATAQILSTYFPCVFCLAERWRYASLQDATDVCPYCNSGEDAKPGLLPASFYRYLAHLERMDREPQATLATVSTADIATHPTVIVTRDFPPLQTIVGDPLPFDAALAVALRMQQQGMVHHAHIVCADYESGYRLWLTCTPDRERPYQLWYQHKSYATLAEGRICLHRAQRGISATQLYASLDQRARRGSWQAQLTD